MINIEQYLTEFEVCSTDAVLPFNTQGNLNTIPTIKSQKHDPLNNRSRDKSLTLQRKMERNRKLQFTE